MAAVRNVFNTQPFEDFNIYTVKIHRPVQRGGGGQGVLTPSFPGPPPFHL